MQFVHAPSDAFVAGPILIACAFLSGSIPFSLLVGLWKGVDIRKVGSGNVGATNLGRALGKGYFFVGFLLDMAKGLVPVLFASAAFGVLGTWAPPSWVSAWVLGCVVASVLGHIYTPFLKFKGGKGVATTFGAVLGFFPLFTFTALVGLLVFLITLALWRYISGSSIAAGIAMSISAFVFALRSEQWNFARVLNGPSMLLVGVMWVLSALVIYKHRANIARLRAGTEPKVGQRVNAQPAATQHA